ncbi:MAG: sigma-70 family RNA polymerase sigma factor [Planctomycetota bacterium]
MIWKRRQLFSRFLNLDRSLAFGWFMARTDQDIQLMLRVKDGDLESFQRLVDRYQQPLINFFFKMTWDHQVAEDCAQEVFLKLYRSRRRYEGTAKFSTFLYRIAKNCLTDLHRRRRVRVQPTSLSEWRDAGGAQYRLGDLVPGNGPGPQQILEGRELQARVSSALDSLSPEQRIVFVMSEHQGLKYADIAEILGVPVGTIKSRMFNAMGRLRESLGVDGDRKARRVGE